MKKIVVIAFAISLFTGAAFAERYIMITHGNGSDLYWPVVEKGGRDAALAIDSDFEYYSSSDIFGMAKLIEIAAASTPDGIIVSLPDADVLGEVIQATVNAGIPVITINSGAEFSAAVGALMHIGQRERLAGQKAGVRAKAAGVKYGLCLNQETRNPTLIDRCEGYFSGLGGSLNMIDVSTDIAQIENRTASALSIDPSIDGILAVGADVCEAANNAIKSVNAAVHLACFDLSAKVMDLIELGDVAFTIDPQQRLQGYMPVIVLHLWNTNAGILPGSNIASGPGFVDKSNVVNVALQAGINR
tara:strand:+ start:496 stop:1401 length:906 start_codon:yes stop_codon:yes gene_type:complete